MLRSSRIRSADEANIVTTWEVPFRRIKLKPMVEYQDAVGLMCIFAFMHFDSIPVRIFQRSWTGVKHLTSVKSPYLGIFQMTPGWNEEVSARLRRAIHILFDYSLIDYEPEKGLCSLHPVIQSWARDRLNDEEQMEWLDYASSILAHCISNELEASGRTFRRALLPHIQSCMEVLRLRHPSLIDSVDRAFEIEKFASVYFETGLWKKAKELQQQVCDYRKKTLGRLHADTVRARQRLAITHYNLFEMEASIKTQLRGRHGIPTTSLAALRWMILPRCYGLLGKKIGPSVLASLQSGDLPNA